MGAAGMSSTKQFVCMFMEINGADEYHQRAMPVPVPEIYSPRWRPPPLSISTRWIWAILAAACLTVLIMAATLQPSPSGEGTHEQLGLQECTWLQRWGFPCPTCGMTTSWTWFAHGNFVASIWVQPMGFLLAILCVLLFWISLYLAVTGRNPSLVMHHAPLVRIFIGLLGLGILAWAWKIFIFLNGMDGWR
jgi:hypothetical protein